MRHFAKLGIGLLVVLALPVLAAPAGGAASPGQKTKETPSPFAELLGGLDWGTGHEQVIAFFEKKIWKDYDDRKKKMKDVLEIEQARRRTADEVAKMRTEYVEFGPDTEAYRVSIIETEFKAGTGEAVFRFEDAEAQRYYFFINDRLWKIFVAFNTAHVRQYTFEAYVEALATRFGEPTRRSMETRKVNKASTEVLAEVVWEDPHFRLRASDQTPFFGTYTQVLSCREIEDRIQELRGEVKGLEATAEPSDPSVKSLLGDITAPPDVHPDSDIIDQILGEQTKVDVVQEMPVSDDDFKPATAPQPGGSAGQPAEPGSQGQGSSGSQPAVDSKGPIIY